jgi:hypothetical protein
MEVTFAAEFRKRATCMCRLSSNLVTISTALFSKTAKERQTGIPCGRYHKI